VLNAENFNRETAGLKEAMQLFNIPKATIIVFDEAQFLYELPEGISVVPAYKWFLK
jgi:hypothetical protein